jgi:hypothetical protein
MDCLRSIRMLLSADGRNGALFMNRGDKHRLTESQAQQSEARYGNPASTMRPSLLLAVDQTHPLPASCFSLPPPSHPEHMHSTPIPPPQHTTPPALYFPQPAAVMSGAVIAIAIAIAIAILSPSSYRSQHPAHRDAAHGYLQMTCRAVPGCVSVHGGMGPCRRGEVRRGNDVETYNQHIQHSASTHRRVRTDRETCMVHPTTPLGVLSLLPLFGHNLYLLQHMCPLLPVFPRCGRTAVDVTALVVVDTCMYCLYVRVYTRLDDRLSFP